MASNLGRPVIYTAAKTEHTKSVRGGRTQIGSTYHPELQQFAGLVTRDYGDGRADLVIFPPRFPSRWVEAVTCGEDAGMFQFTAGPNAKGK